MGFIHKITFVPRFVRQAFYQTFNRLMFKSAGATIGRNFKVRNRFYLKLYKDATLTIGDNFTVFSGEAINPIARNVRGCFYINGGGNFKHWQERGYECPYHLVRRRNRHWRRCKNRCFGHDLRH